MPAIREMFDLQAADLEIDRRKERLAEIAGRLGNDSSLKGLRVEARSLEESVRKLTGRQRDLEEATGDIAQRIQAAEAKLYGGTITNPRELKDLQDDIAQLGRQRSDRETGLLEVMDDLEAEQAKLHAASQRLSDAERAWKQDQEHMAREKDMLQRELAELSEERGTRASLIPPAELSLYEQVRRRHAGKAVAIVRNGTCQSCRTVLPTRQTQNLKTSATLVRCPSCGLILLPE